MKKRAAPKLDTPQQRRREQERQFKPLAQEIGWIAFEWNRLQEALAELFADAISDHQPIALKVWHSVRSDLTQREMLKAAAEHRSATVDTKLRPLWAAVVWLTNQASTLSQKRNDALHVPFVFVTHADKIEILPLYFFGNPKAQKLATKELLKEFNWYRKSAAALADYAETLHFAVTFPEDYPLPQRPVMPSLGQKATPKRSPRRNKSNQSQRQPRS